VKGTWKRSHHRIGKKNSLETRRKIGKAHKGKTITTRQREKISKTLTGRKPTVEARRNMSLASKGKPKSTEHSKNIGKAHKGLAKPKLWGENSPAHKLTEQQVRDILYIYEHYRTKNGKRLRRGMGKALAEQYGVDQATISAIGTRRTWRHIK
jgi:hypothetical protein